MGPGPAEIAILNLNQARKGPAQVPLGDQQEMLERRTKSIRRHPLSTRLALYMTLVLVTTVLAIGGYAYFRAVDTIRDLSGRIIRQASNSIDFRIEALIVRAESQTKVLGGLVGPAALASGDRLDSSIFDRIAMEMVVLIKANPEFSSMSVVLEQTGEYVQVDRRPNGSIVARTTRSLGGGRYLLEDLQPFGEQLTLSRRDRDWRYDARESPEYQAVAENRELTWISATEFESIDGQSLPTIICAVPIYDARGRFQGVVSSDITLADFSRFVNTLTVGQSGFAFVMEASGHGEYQIIAHPDASRLLRTQFGSQTLSPTDQFEDPVTQEMIRRIAESSLPEPGGVMRTNFKVGDVSYFGGFQRVTGERAPNWIMAVVVPVDDFMGNLARDAVVFLVVLLIGLGFGVGLSLVLAQRIAKPLKQLASETSRIRELDLSSRPMPSSSIQEVAALAEGVEQMKRGLRSFEKLVPSDYARWLLKSGKEARLGGKRERLTIYFADIVGFTSLTEQLEPEQLAEILADYLDILSGEVLAHAGTIDKFNGDDVMAFWGAPSPLPKHAEMACRAALSSQQKLLEHHPQWAAEGKPTLKASFGLATGDVIVGNVGSRKRMNYTVIGDCVNLASRLQGLNKHYGTEILITEDTYEATQGLVLARPIDFVSVYGKANSVKVYEMLALEEKADQTQKEIAGIHTMGMELYLHRRWDAAQKEFEKILSIKENDAPAQILIDRCIQYRKEEPDEEWDGSFVMKVK